MTNDWQTQLKNSIRTHRDTEYPAFIPPFLANKIEQGDPGDILKKQFLPSEQEFEESNSGLLDPIGDELHSPVPGLIHRYTNRVLFTPTEHCPVNCRYCFRKNELGKQKDFLKSDFKQIINYLKNHPEVEELIFTGGDPLVLSDEKIFSFLTEFSKIESLKFIRFHTRMPVVIPNRINKSFTELIQKFDDRFIINIVLHINHLQEWSEEFEAALKMMTSARINLMSQSVLLKGINDDADVLVNLFRKLSLHHVRPYYLHHPDQVRGAMHFYLPLKEGREIYAKLRDCLPGWALPNYVIDIPGGEGKTPAFNPEAFDFSGKLINRKGEISEKNHSIS